MVNGTQAPLLPPGSQPATWGSQLISLQTPSNNAKKFKTFNKKKCFQVSTQELHQTIVYL
jgi:hypothetical protein